MQFRSVCMTVAVLALASSASAQLPSGTTYNSGTRGGYVAGARDAAGRLHVVFDESSGNMHWIPGAGAPVLRSSPYGKFFDGSRDFFIAAGPHGPLDYFTIASATWAPLPAGAGAIGNDFTMTAWESRMAWVEVSPATGEHRVGFVPSPTVGVATPFLDGNGRQEEQLSLHGNRLAYAYGWGSGSAVAIHDLATDTEIYHGPAGSSWPDLVADRLAYQTDSGTVEVVDLSSGRVTGVAAPYGCVAERPLLAGPTGRWVAYAVWCSGSTALRVYDLLTGYDTHFADIAGSRQFHVGQDWIVWSDRTGTVMAYDFSASAVPPLPVDRIYRSDIRGNDPATVVDNRGRWHAIFTNNRDTIDWEPDAGARTAIGAPMRSYNGKFNTVAAEIAGEIHFFELASGRWTHVGRGSYPASWDDAIAWETSAHSPDFAIEWMTPSSSGLVFPNDDADQRLPALFKDLAAIEYHDGTAQRIQVVVLPANTVVATIGGTSNRRTPDIWDTFLVLVDDALGLRYLDDFRNPATERAVPVPTGCRARLPRLAGEGKWVIYETYGCATEGLFLVNMGATNPTPWFVDLVAPPRGFSPQYSAVGDRISYVRRTGEVIHVDVDERRL